MDYCSELYGEKIPLKAGIDMRLPKKDAWQKEEHYLQRAFFMWLNEIAANSLTYQHTRLLLWTAHAIPNGGKRNVAEAGRLVAEGVKSGVPDVFIPIPLHGHSGLYIEFKKAGESPSEEQRVFLNTLSDRGHRCYVFNCLEEAKRLTLEYITPLLSKELINQLRNGNA